MATIPKTVEMELPEFKEAVADGTALLMGLQRVIPKWVDQKLIDFLVRLQDDPVGLGARGGGTEGGIQIREERADPRAPRREAGQVALGAVLVGGFERQVAVRVEEDRGVGRSEEGEAEAPAKEKAE